MSTNSLEAVLKQFITTTGDALTRLEQQAERDRKEWNRYKREEAKKREEETKKHEEETRKREEETRKREEETRKREEKREEEAKRRGEKREEEAKKHEIERKKERKAWNKRWGDLANRLGRVVEDIVAPNISRIGRDYFGYTDPPSDFSIRRKVYYQGKRDKQREFDTIAVYPDIVIFNETKEAVRQKDLEQFVDFINSGEFFDYFPEYQGRKLIPIFSSLYLDESVINYLTKKGVYALAMNDETMDLLNFDQLKHKRH
ncbi:hypothetical protein QUF58_09385 [Anaerolineales bacterium HSG24]|nr:hypothetical protein [Anaerolineales bacterium HSG24]